MFSIFWEEEHSILFPTRGDCSSVVNSRGHGSTRDGTTAQKVVVLRTHTFSASQSTQSRVKKTSMWSSG